MRLNNGIPGIALIISVLNLYIVISKSAVCVPNEGIAFGINLYLASILSFLFILLLLYLSLKSKEDLRYNLLGIAILGSGNLIERVTQGYICDYLKFMSLYINIVDIGITVLVFFSLISLTRNLYEGKNRG